MWEVESVFISIAAESWAINPIVDTSQRSKWLSLFTPLRRVYASPLAVWYCRVKVMGSSSKSGVAIWVVSQPLSLWVIDRRNPGKSLCIAIYPTPHPPSISCSKSLIFCVKISASIKESPKKAMRTGRCMLLRFSIAASRLSSPFCSVE